ncbi:MAG: FHA domain-containing protein [Solirubrobacteraceae bacterium]
MSSPGAQLRLLVTDGNARGTQIVVEDPLLIGRRAEGQGRLAGDPEISGRHAEIRPVAGGFVVADVGSRHGTAVNGDAVTVPRGLEVGDRIEVGASTLMVQTIIPGASAPDEPDPGPEPAPGLSLTLDIDAVSGVGQLDLGMGTKPIPLVHRDGRWEIGS